MKRHNVFTVHYELNINCGCIWGRFSTLATARAALRDKKLNAPAEAFIVKVTTERVGR